MHQRSTIERRRRLTMRSIALKGIAMVAIVLASTGLVAIPRAPGKPTVADHMTPLGGSVGPGWSMVTGTGIGAEMAGLTWTGGAATADIRAFDGTRWGDWIQLVGEPDEGPDQGSKEFKPGKVFAGPTWLGQDITKVEVRMTSGTVTDLQLHAIESKPAVPATGTAFGVLPVAEPAGAAVPPAFVIPRASWGADESFRTINAGCSGNPDYATSTRFAVVHHTVNSNNYAPEDSASLVRGIYYFHTHDNGWCDIGYNFLIDRYGQVFEGRAGGPNRSVIGAHAGGFNTYSTGVAMIGNFDIAPVPQAAYDALRGLLAWKMGYHGINPLGTSVIVPFDFAGSRFPAGQPVEINNLIGHTDVDTTECPGRYLYALIPQLRQDVASDIAAFPDTRFTGDWNGDGKAGIGVFQSGVFALRDDLSEGAPQHFAFYGNPTDTPVVGDWTGNGTDTIGVVRDGVWYLRNSNTSGVADITFTYGNPGDIPVVGDWTGNGTDTIGVVRDGVWYLRNSNTPGPADIVFAYGDPTDRPVVGDWAGTGASEPGVFRNGMWYLRKTQTSGFADISIGYGDAGDTPVPYRINGTQWGLGVARGSYWFLSDGVDSTKVSYVIPY